MKVEPDSKPLTIGALNATRLMSSGVGGGVHTVLVAIVKLCEI